MLVALMLTFATLVAEPTCTVGTGASSWSGSPADLATIEAVHQREQADLAGQAFPNGSPERSPWSALVRCSV